MNYGQADLTNQHVFDTSDGPMYNGTPATIGGPVDAWVSRDGSFTATAIAGSNFKLQYSRLRPDVLVVAGNGGFLLNSVAAQSGSGFDAWSFIGAVTEMGINGVIAMQQLPGGGSGTNGSGIGIRPNWNGDGFQGNDSSIRPMLPNGGTFGGNLSIGYSLGAQNQWHNFAIGRATPAAGPQVLGYMPQEIQFENNEGFVISASRTEFIFGGASVWDGTTFTPNLDIEIAHFGVWSNIGSFDNLEALSVSMNQPRNSASRSIKAYGDSRLSSQTALGTLQEGNTYGYHLNIGAVQGQGIPGIDAELDADILAGRTYGAGVCWIGTNHFGGANPLGDGTELDQLIAWVRKASNAGTFGHLYLCLDTPRGNATQQLAFIATGANEALYDFSIGIQRLFEGHPGVTVVNTWDAVRDYRNRLWIDETLSNDGTHLNTLGVDGTNRGYERILRNLVMPLIQERLESLPDNVTTQNARSLDLRIQELTLRETRKIPRGTEEIDAGVLSTDGIQFEILDAIPTTDADGFVTVATNNDKTGYALTAATMASLFDDADAQTQLANFFSGLDARFDNESDIAPSVIVATMLMNPQFMQLIADAAAAKTAAEANKELINGIPAAVEGELDPITTQIIQDIADIAVEGPVGITDETLASIREGLATAAQANAIKADTEKTFKDGDSIKVTVQEDPDAVPGEESLLALHTRVGTQEPPAGE